MNILRRTIACTLGTVLFLNISVNGQAVKIQPKATKNWHTLDLATTGYYGISLNKAYLFLKGKKSKTVVVATIDSGVDTLQKDLRAILWTNTKEIPNNGIDDDGNGYIDDIHGWNFLGGPDGKCDHNETTEEVREYARLKDKWAVTRPQSVDNKEYQYWLKVKDTHDSTIAKSTRIINQVSPVMNILVGTSTYIKRELKLKPADTFTAKDLDRIKTKNDTVLECKSIWATFFSQDGTGANNAKIIKDLNDYLTKLNNDVNPDLEARKRIVGDDPDNWDDKKGYGSNLLKFPDGNHGTMVAGFIGAIRGNKYGTDGVADNVRLMVVKAVPDGDEYDKDVAHAIRYAVDNGARIINMSFGKKISPHKDWVDAAFKYAEEHDVLLVQAAGNDSQNLDEKPDYPNTTFLDGTVHKENVINVGASGPKRGANLAAEFTNYGKKAVDVFAPGVKVTAPGMDEETATEDGTSFASPITAGVAALIMEYYPTLSAKQVKQAIVQSAKPLTGLMVVVPAKEDDDKKTKAAFTSLSQTGGIINAYQALLIASKMKGERK